MLQALTIADPVERSLALAPVEEETETEEELEGVREARAQAARGELIPDDQLELEAALLAALRTCVDAPCRA
jgi:hypothetical protein